MACRQVDKAATVHAKHSGATKTGAIVMAPDGFTIVRLVNQFAILEYQEPEPQEQYFEPFIPTAWKLEQNRYDRINAKRKYLSDVARAKRHLGIKKPIRKPNRRRNKR